VIMDVTGNSPANNPLAKDSSVAARYQ
jgi:hypothetical protein